MRVRVSISWPPSGILCVHGGEALSVWASHRILSRGFHHPLAKVPSYIAYHFTLHVRFRRTRSTVFYLYFNHRFIANAHHIFPSAGTHAPHVVPRGGPFNKRV